MVAAKPQAPDINTTITVPQIASSTLPMAYATP
jgi:hypothetical protein